MGAALLPLAETLGPALIGGISSFMGGSQQNSASAQQAQKQMDFQASQQKESEAFSERMSDTSWQRGTADMKAAGINPLLAFGQGGASSPSVGQGSGAQAPVQNVLGPAVSSAMDSLRTASSLKLLANQSQEAAARARGAEADANRKTFDNIIDYNWSPLSGKKGGSMGLAGSLQMAVRQSMLDNLRATGSNLSSSASVNRSIEELNKAALPGAKVEGSRFGGQARVFGGILGNSARAMANIGGLFAGPYPAVGGMP